MSDTLTNKEVDELVKLGKDIQAGLSCDANGTGEPCRTDRLDAISNMKRYLEIHEYDVIAPGKYKNTIEELPSKSQREEKGEK